MLSNQQSAFGSLLWLCATLQPGMAKLISWQLWYRNNHQTSICILRILSTISDYFFLFLFRVFLFVRPCLGHTATSNGDGHYIHVIISHQSHSHLCLIHFVHKQLNVDYIPSFIHCVHSTRTSKAHQCERKSLLLTTLQLIYPYFKGLVSVLSMRAATQLLSQLAMLPKSLCLSCIWPNPKSVGYIPSSSGVIESVVFFWFFFFLFFFGMASRLKLTELNFIKLSSVDNYYHSHSKSNLFPTTH